MKSVLGVVLGMVLGVTGLAGYRFFFVPPEAHPHFHANFALFVDGERVDLRGDRYMEEVGACKVSETVLPTERVHLHNNNQDVVHVHHGGVTWDHFLINLRMGLGDKYLALDDGRILTAGPGKSLKFVLNGQPQFSVRNVLLRSGDRLLISYGAEAEAEVVRSQFPQVATTAEEFNGKPDPAGCSGATEPTLGERLRDAFVG
ncbi:MAG: hypothetical protein KY464_05670 [Gemmatimonadetes bacterium]|nr:hypothetical protein [Gemmatimonadota bacterium]